MNPASSVWIDKEGDENDLSKVVTTVIVAQKAGHVHKSFGIFARYHISHFKHPFTISPVRVVWAGETDGKRVAGHNAIKFSFYPIPAIESSSEFDSSFSVTTSSGCQVQITSFLLLIHFVTCILMA